MVTVPIMSIMVGYVAATVDGRISLTDTSLPDWTSAEDAKFLKKSLATCDAVVVGRNTYIAAESRLKKRRTFVLTSRVKTQTEDGSVTFVNPKSVDLAKLLEGYRKVAVLGGGSAYRYMLEAGLIDELFVTIEPLIFGRGKEMISNGTRTTRATLQSVKKLNKRGTILLHYTIEKQK